MNNTYIVSIVIPTRNRSALLSDTLESIQAQTYPHWEAIVVDDGSTDDTAACMKVICQEEPRIVFRQRKGEKSNANVCRNQGLSAAKGKYVIFLDSDDLLSPDCLQHRVRDMEAHPDLSYIAYPGELFARTPGDLGLLWNVFTSEPDLERFLRVDTPWHTTGPIWRKETLGDLKWDEELRSWQDGDFHARALIAGLPYGRVNRPDYFIRRGEGHTDRISKNDGMPDELVSHIDSFCRMGMLLRQHGLFTSINVHFLGAVCYQKCQALLHAYCKKSALAGWKKCYNAKCCSRVKYLEGMIAFSMAHMPVLDRIAREYLRWRWSSYMNLSQGVSRIALIQSDRVMLPQPFPDEIMPGAPKVRA